MARLLLMRKNRAPRQVDLAGARTLVGRDASNDLRIDHPEVSRHHMEFRIEGATTWLIDLASRNGTLVNGRRVRHLALEHGDVIGIGDCSIRFLTRQTGFEPSGALALTD